MYYVVDITQNYHEKKMTVYSYQKVYSRIWSTHHVCCCIHRTILCEQTLSFTKV